MFDSLGQIYEFFLITNEILKIISIFVGMNESLKIKARESGFKVKALAEKIGISANYLSMCLNGLKTLSPEKEQALKRFLDKIPT